jgi:hypothetical protein
VELLEKTVDVTGNCDEKERNRRRRCVLTAMDALTRGVRKNWLSPMGVLTSWVVHAVTQSEIALKILNGLGIGCPVGAPQTIAYTEMEQALRTSQMVAGLGTDVVGYCDNTQSGNVKTSSMRVNRESRRSTILPGQKDHREPGLH